MAKSASFDSVVSSQADKAALLSFCIAFCLTLSVRSLLDHPSGDVSTALFFVVGTPGYLVSRLAIWGLPRLRGLTFHWIRPREFDSSRPVLQ